MKKGYESDEEVKLHVDGRTHKQNSQYIHSSVRLSLGLWTFIRIASFLDK